MTQSEDFAKAVAVVFWPIFKMVSFYRIFSFFWRSFLQRRIHPFLREYFFFRNMVRNGKRELHMCKLNINGAVPLGVPNNFS